MAAGPPAISVVGSEARAGAAKPVAAVPGARAAEAEQAVVRLAREPVLAAQDRGLTPLAVSASAREEEPLMALVFLEPGALGAREGWPALAATRAAPSEAAAETAGKGAKVSYVVTRAPPI
jgi:hypothetical protein